jgi:hypothetical protein
MAFGGGGGGGGGACWASSIYFGWYPVFPDGADQPCNNRGVPFCYEREELRAVSDKRHCTVQYSKITYLKAVFPSLFSSGIVIQLPFCSAWYCMSRPPGFVIPSTALSYQAPRKNCLWPRDFSALPLGRGSACWQWLEPIRASPAASPASPVKNYHHQLPNHSRAPFFCLGPPSVI